MSDLLSFVVALLVILPLGGSCLWASYRLGRRLRVAGEISAALLGIILVPLPFNLAFFILLHLLHLHHDAQYAFTGIVYGGSMGMRAARLQNLERTRSKPLLGGKPR